MTAAGTAISVSSRQRAPSVLAIDDSVGTLELIKSALAEFELEIATASDPAEGLDLFSKLRPPIVLLDLVMTGMHGMEVLRSLGAVGTASVTIERAGSTQQLSVDASQVASLSAPDTDAAPPAPPERPPPEPNDT